MRMEQWICRVQGLNNGRHREGPRPSRTLLLPRYEEVVSGQPLVGGFSVSAPAFKRPQPVTEQGPSHYCPGPAGALSGLHSDMTLLLVPSFYLPCSFHRCYSLIHLCTSNSIAVIDCRGSQTSTCSVRKHHKTSVTWNIKHFLLLMRLQASWAIVLVSAGSLCLCSQLWRKWAALLIATGFSHRLRGCWPWAGPGGFHWDKWSFSFRESHSLVSSCWLAHMVVKGFQENKLKQTRPLEV